MPSGGHNRGPSCPAEEFPGAGLTEEQWRFGQAMERYMRTRRRPYPTWREVLAVARALGYRREEKP